MFSGMIRKTRGHIGRTWLGRWLRLELNYTVRLRPALRRQLRLTTPPVNDRRGKSRILIPLIETNHYQFYQILGLAKALELRGAEVRVLLCGSRLSGCEIKNVKSFAADPCLDCRFNHNRVVKLFGLDVVQLSDFITEEEVIEIKRLAATQVATGTREYRYQGVDLVRMVDESVVRFYYGAEPDSNSVEAMAVRQSHFESAMIGVTVARKIVADWAPAAMLAHMNVYSAWQPYAEIAKLEGIPFDLVSITPFNYNSVVLNSTDLYLSDARFRRWLDARSEKRLSEQEQAELNHFVAERITGRSQVFRDYGFFAEQSKEAEAFRAASRQKRRVTLFSNVYWDVGINEGAALYPGVVEWVLDTIDIVKDRPDIHLYVKPHPAEVFDSVKSLKGVVGHIREHFPVLPKNVTIIDPEWKVNTYDLLKDVDVGVVFNGTLGLEMILQGVPVIAAGRAPYSNLNCVNSPANREEYRRLLCGEGNIRQPDGEEAALFAYFYLVKCCLPWTLTKRSYRDRFDGYAFECLDDLFPGKDKYLDHLCACILHEAGTIPEVW